MEKFLASLETYYVTIAVFVVFVYAEAGLLEIIKKGMENWTDKGKGSASMVAALILSAIFVCGIYVGLPHPGNVALLPGWYALFVVCQYFADFNGGVKAVFKALTTVREPKQKEPKKPRPRYGKFPLDDDGRPII